MCHIDAGQPFMIVDAFVHRAIDYAGIEMNRRCVVFNSMKYRMFWKLFDLPIELNEMSKGKTQLFLKRVWKS